MGQKCMETVSSFLFEYDTPRMVLVRNKKVGVTFRLIQVVVLAYIIGLPSEPWGIFRTGFSVTVGRRNKPCASRWVFLYEKGYQSKDGIISSVSVKLKGLTLTNFSDMGPYIWDVADYVFPPQGDSSFVVMTNFIVTRGQKQEKCAEHPEAGKCDGDGKCAEGTFLRQGQGIMTGKCVNFSHTQKTCEIFGWCPVEIDDEVPNPPLLLAAENFTLFIKNSITFPKFKVARRNLVEKVTKAYLRNCTYHQVRDPLCPVFRLGRAVEASGQSFASLARKGGVVGITISWDCDLDWPIKHCVPVYQFHGLYNEDNNISPGFNFRHARYYRENGRDVRNLYKVFGIRFDILVNGKAGKFDIIPTMTTIGSGIGIFGVASLVCDVLLLNFLSNRDYYKQKKFKYAQQDSVPPEKEDGDGFFMSDLHGKDKGPPGN
ncbi:P2X purinoceptor 1 isoform X1 [Anolis carolinensis]|uniref:P2X purinoceptor 1 isoform X1 n=1 Tax=Anolis carolinensis TaxID=28377 RepID=UPI002F2B58D2